LHLRIGIKWANTGCRVDASARPMKLNCLSFCFTNLLLRILWTKQKKAWLTDGAASDPSLKTQDRRLRLPTQLSVARQKEKGALNSGLRAPTLVSIK